MSGCSQFSVTGSCSCPRSTLDQRGDLGSRIRSATGLSHCPSVGTPCSGVLRRFRTRSRRRETMSAELRRARRCLRSRWSTHAAPTRTRARTPTTIRPTTDISRRRRPGQRTPVEATSDVQTGANHLSGRVARQRVGAGVRAAAARTGDVRADGRPVCAGCGRIMARGTWSPRCTARGDVDTVGPQVASASDRAGFGGGVQGDLVRRRAVARDQNGGGSSLGSGPVLAGGGGFGTGSSGGRYR